MLSILLALVLFAAAGCGRTPSPTAISPTATSPRATVPPAKGQEAQPSDDTSPLPQPKSGQPDSATSPLPTPTPTPEPSGEGAVIIPDEAAEPVQAAQADLAERLGIEKGEIKVLSVEAVEWRDGSLGCPQPGMAYDMVITPGFRVVLEVEGNRYAYHTDTTRRVVLCQPDESGSKAPPPLEKAILIYERSGGLAGLTELWVVYDDGRVATGDGREFYVTPEEVAGIVSKAKALGFFDMANEYIPKNTCCDRLSYSITIQGQHGMHTVETMDGTESAPRALWDLLDTVTQLVEHAFSVTGQDALDVAVADLATRLVLDRTAIHVLEVTRQEFPLPDLGCPSADGKGKESVLPAIVLGQLIRLRAKDADYEYHAWGQDVRFCGAQPN
jgi:hypothetical protein